MYNDFVQERYTQLLPEYRMDGIAKSFCNFLNPEIAEAIYRDINENIEFIPHNSGYLTKMHCASRPIGRVYDGDLLHLKETEDSIIFKKFMKIIE